MDQKRLYRSRNALVGGVCAGIAEYFKTDAVLFRVLAVVLALASGGLLGIAYVALWIVLPETPRDLSTVDVWPEQIRSEAYGQVTYETTSTAEDKPLDYSPNTPAKIAVCAGLFFLYLGVLLVTNAFVIGVDWQDLWPLIFVIAGMGYMVVPGKPGKRMKHFVDGLLVFCIGVFLLPMSIGVTTWESVYSIADHLWPLLLLMLILFGLATITGNRVLLFFGGLAFAAFCFVGVFGFSYPGPTNVIILDMFDRYFVIDINLLR